VCSNQHRNIFLELKCPNAKVFDFALVQQTHAAATSISSVGVFELDLLVSAILV